MIHAAQPSSSRTAATSAGSAGFPGSVIGAVRRTLTATIRPWLRTPRGRGFAFHYERVLGTSLELQVVATDADVARRAEVAVLAEVDRLAAILSGYDATSELARWQEQHGVLRPVSPDLADVLSAAERWRVRTAGAVNPAAAALMQLLRDNPSDGGMDSGARQRALYGLRLAMRQPLWTVNRARGAACRLTELPVSLDAIAKGYIVDRAAVRAGAVDGVTQVLVNIGGDLRHFGTRPLVVGVADPRAPAENTRPIATVRLTGGALATSGGYRRSFAMDGRAVSHIIDPRSGAPVSRVISASVIAPDCMSADALSTAFSVLAPVESIALADALDGVGCLIVARDGTIASNDAWRERAAA